MKIGPVLLGALLVASCTPVDAECSQSADTQAPTNATQALTTATQATTAATQAPTTATQATTAATQAPTTATQATTAATQALTTATQATTAATQAPTNATQAPTNATQAPSTAAHTGCDSATRAPTEDPPSVCTSDYVVDAMVLMSASRCVGAENMTIIQDFLKQLVDILINNDTTKNVGIMTYGNSTELVTPLTGNKTALIEGAGKAVFLDGEENTAEGIRAAQQELTKQIRSTALYLFLFMACQPTNLTAAVVAAKTAEEKSIEIGVAAVEGLVDTTDAEAISTGFYYPISGIPKLNTIVPNVTSVICYHD